MGKKMMIWDEKEDNMFCGYIGEKTKMVDMYGEPIFVGDDMKCKINTLDMKEVTVSINSRDDIYNPLRLGQKLLIIDKYIINIRNISYVEFIEE